MIKENGPEDVAFLRAEVKRLRKALRDLTPSLEILLRRRGFKVYKKEPRDDLLIPMDKYIDDYYRLLHKYSFRLFLRDVIKHQDGFTMRDVTRYATTEVTEDYINVLLDFSLIEKTSVRQAHDVEERYRLIKRPIKSFGPTLEWFMAETLKREFEADTIWGVRFKRPVVGGDYDLISKINGSILYMEIKSSPPKQIYDREVAAFLNRITDLKPEIAIFFMDTELRMKDKIVPMFEDEFKKRSAEARSAILSQPDKIEIKRIEKELFQIEGKIFIINAKESIVNNLERILSFYFKGHGRNN
ncbi:MAG: hypothetical protein ACK415_00260 [Thermodesulfovibrionales bacterium]